MKKHPFLKVDFHSTVELTSAERRKMGQWLEYASEALGAQAKKGLFPKGAHSVHVSFLLCGDARIRKLNREHRGKDKVTDVLSFPALDDVRKMKSFQDGELFLGDLAICLPQAKRQAKEFSIGLWDEFIHLFFHGTLHLLGYDHEISLKEEKLMQEWEDSCLEKFSEIKKVRK